MDRTAIIKILIITLMIINAVLTDLSDNLTDITYDFIIVGGGSAGCILASRLSENPNHSVLLLETGTTPDLGLDIPPTTSKYFPGNIKLYNSIPQNTLGLGDNRTICYFVGKLLGGTSQINGMIYNLGHPEDYNYWASVTGDCSWNYRNMSKYFEKVQKMIPISQPKYAPGLTEWIDGGRFLGYPSFNSGYPSDPQRVSFAPFAFTKYRGRRASSYNYYIKPIYKDRPNLHIKTKAEVKRLLFHGTEATGVVYEILVGGGGEGSIDNLYKAFATKEVILSSGVFGSPAILLRSGIGPKEEIDKYGVTPVKYLPVGQNLQDHLSVRLDFILNNQSAAFVEDKDLTPENLKLFNKTGDGPYSTSFGMSAQAFIVSSEATKTGHGDWPDLHLVSMHTPTLKGSKEWNEFRRFHLEKINHSKEVVVTAASVLTRAKSRGNFRLNETNINGDPLIDYQFLSHPEDIEAVLEGMKILLKLYEETPAFQRIGARLAPIPHPSCNRKEFRSEEYWRCYIRYVSCTALHAMGTCKMGKSLGDPNAVVDSHLRVIGLSNLMVVDASVIPVANSNPQVGVYALAEKAAEIILEKWGNARK